MLSAAQKDFGDLVTLAAQGEPQVLVRNTTPVAVLLRADPASSALSTDMAAHPGAATAGGAVNSQGNQDRGSTPRRLATLGDAMSVLTDGPVGGPTFGLPGLDAATGGLQPGRLTLVAAPRASVEACSVLPPRGRPRSSTETWSCTPHRDRTATTSSAGSSSPRPAVTTRA